jgi:hypothetical protein
MRLESLDLDIWNDVDLGPAEVAHLLLASLGQTAPVGVLTYEALPEPTFNGGWVRFTGTRDDLFELAYGVWGDGHEDELKAALDQAAADGTVARLDVDV